MSRELTEYQKTRLLVLNTSVAAMQNLVFYCEDDEGVLRRWTPPRPVKLENDTE